LKEQHHAQQAKIKQLRNCNLSIPSNLVFIAIDFEKESLSQLRHENTLYGEAELVKSVHKMDTAQANIVANLLRKRLSKTVKISHISNVWLSYRNNLVF
jgi:hypothetical protein